MARGKSENVLPIEHCPNCGGELKIKGITPRRHPKRTSFGSAVNAQQISASPRDRFKSVGCHVRGAVAKKKGF